MRDLGAARIAAYATPTLAMIGAIETARVNGWSFPVPFLSIMVSVIFSGAWGGRHAGIIAGALAGVFVIHSFNVGYGPPSLTGDSIRTMVGFLLFVSTGFLLGRLRDQRDDSVRRLRARERRLESSLRKETSAREKHQLQIAESEARLQQAVKVAGLGYFIYDAIDDKCVYCSEGHAAHHEMTAAEYLAQDSSIEGELALAHPEDRDMVRAQFRRLRNGEPIDMEYRILTKDGRTKYVREITEPVFDDNGVVIREVGTSFDITKLRGAEARLRQKQKLEAIGALTAGIAHDFNNWISRLSMHRA